MSLSKKIKFNLFVKWNIYKFKLLSNNKPIKNKPKLVIPVLFSGKGTIELGTNVYFGYYDSAMYFNHYSYVEARTPEAKITIGNNVYFNNNLNLVAMQEITIQSNCVIGINCTIMDSDFHNLNPKERMSNNPSSNPVFLEENVFLGNNVTLLKGVTIGKNSVVGSNSVVTKSVPENVVVAGNPAKIIKQL